MDDGAELLGARHEQRVEPPAQRLNALPGTVLVGAVGLEARCAVPRDPDAGMARQSGEQHPVEHAQLTQRRLDARVQRLARALSRQLAALQQRHAQPAAGAGDRGRRTGGTGPDDHHVGVGRMYYAVWTACHAPPARLTSSCGSAPANIVARSASCTRTLR